MLRKSSIWSAVFDSVMPYRTRWIKGGVLGVIAIHLFATGALAGEAVLVHDIAPPHPRYKNFYEMVAEVAKSTSGLLTIAINPGGKVVYPGQASLDAVRSGKAPLTFVNSAFLQSINPSLGFVNLPFTVNDEMMKPGVSEGIIKLIQSYVEPSGLRVLGMMRGADTIFIFRKHQVRNPEDLKGLKIRVAGPGVYQEIVRSFGAEPAVIPAIEMGSALERGVIDGIITSPGGWGKNVQDAPIGSLVPGLIFYTYFMIADKAWLDGLPSEQRLALIDAARTKVTERWRDMQQDDSELISTLVTRRGASFWSVPASELRPWKERVEGVTRKFANAYPEVIQQFRAIVPPGNR
jgi:TRAP-type C4-dicarboxylate transport system substrate-binding protein